VRICIYNMKLLKTNRCHGGKPFKTKNPL